ncbi:MAG: hypothetical protein ABI208_09290, partial [Ginsengibacter sp.]
MKKDSFYDLLFLAIFLIGFAGSSMAQTIRYVKAGTTGDGASWSSSSGDIQLMINKSAPGDQVWVASGTYTPKYNAENMDGSNPNDRNNAFVMKEGVSLIGSFAGNETSLGDRTMDVIKNNPSILSGDIGTPKDSSDNTYHVMISVNCTNASLIDGFTLKDGFGYSFGSIVVNSTTVLQQAGGGLCNYNSTLKLVNLTITGNSASDGGGIYNLSGGPSMFNVTIDNNKAHYGGGINERNCSPQLIGVVVSNNIADIDGGGIYNDGSAGNYTNIKITGNSAAGSGGGISNINKSYPVIDFGDILSNIAIAAGGGILNEKYSETTIINTKISGNKANKGGGMFSAFSTAILTNVLISGNLAINEGAGVYNNYSSFTITNGTISSNYKQHGASG